MPYVQFTQLQDYHLTCFLFPDVQEPDLRLEALQNQIKMTGRNLLQNRHEICTMIISILYPIGHIFICFYKNVKVLLVWSKMLFFRIIKLPVILLWDHRSWWIGLIKIFNLCKIIFALKKEFAFSSFISCHDCLQNFHSSFN